jgi:hemolysin activation/secretion protein
MERHLRYKKLIFFILIYLFLNFIFKTNLVLAQAPSSTKVGIIEKQMEEEARPEEERKPVLKEVPKPLLEEMRPTEAVVEEKVEGKILIKKFILNGVTLFKVEDFSPFLSQYRDKYLRVGDFNEIANYIQKFYRQKGYITTFVYVPVQKIVDNTIEVRVIEGCIGNIEVEGGKYFDKEFVRKRFRVREGDLVLYKDLIRNIRGLNTNPDRTVKAVLLPGERKETTDIVLKVTDQNPRHVFLEYNNRGTKYTGKSRFGVGFEDNNLFGFDDMLSLRYQRSNERLNGGSIDYNIPINYLGTRLGGYFGYAKVDIVKEFKPLEAKGKAVTGGAYLVHPFLDEEHLRGNAGIGLDIKHNKNYILGTEISSDDLSVVKLNLSLNSDDQFGATFFGNELDFGIPDFAGSLSRKDPKASRLDTGGDFTRYILHLIRRQDLPFSSFFLVSGRTQYTPDKLVAGEQFYIGGQDTVRGYPELEYMGDYGYNFNLELRTPVYLVPKKAKLYDKIQMVYFWDFGKGYLRDALVGEKKSESLMGAGWGLRISPWKNFYLRLDWGFPLDPKPSDKSKSTVHIWAHIELF